MNFTDRTIHAETPESQPNFDRTISEEELTGRGKREPDGNWALQETEAAIKLHCRIGAIRCVAADWYIQENGIWVPRSKDEYRAIALEVLPPKWRTNQHALQVINRLESEQQVSQSLFCAAAKFDRDGAVLLPPET